MAQDRDQYVQFSIKLLKGSFALNALWQDAMNYHMIDQPDKLIALRLTEYYEMVSRGVARPGPSAQVIPPAPAVSSVGNNAVPSPQPQPVQSSVSGRLPQLPPQGQQVEEYKIENLPDVAVTASLSSVEQNAEEAADYWSPL